MLIAEGAYPFYYGGVSTWCHSLLSETPETDFVMYSIIDDPDLAPKFIMPQSVVDFRPEPLWGIRERLEAKRDLTMVELFRRKARSIPSEVEDVFIPDFRAFVRAVFTGDESPLELSQLLQRMHRFFMQHDYDSVMRSQAAWLCFLEVVQEEAPRILAQSGYPAEIIGLSETITAIQRLYHWLLPLGSPVPKVDVAHAAMAGICTLVAVLAKMEHGAAFLLTEHGVYLRERYFFETGESTSVFLKCFGLGFSTRMNEISYGMADEIWPCCDYNKRWELKNGADPAKLRTVHYGVDSTRFASQGDPVNDPPVVVWMGRIDPLKDLFTLLQAAALVQQARPDIQFRLFGSASPENEAYFEKCLAMRRELGIEETLDFAGYRSDAWNAYNEGDIFVLTSMSEAFPFANLEAMSCERPVVSSAVGGVPEQLEGCGYAVEPRNPEAMAHAILVLANDPLLRRQLGQAGREKVIQNYNIPTFIDTHRAAYVALATQTTSQPKVPSVEATTPFSPDPDPDPRAISADGVRADLTSLAEEIAQRCSKPINALEIAAQLEAQGITDAVASKRYGFRTTFELGDALLALVRKIDSRPGKDDRPKVPTPNRERVLDYLRGPISLFPVLCIMLMITIYQSIGQWSLATLMAFSIGMSSSMVLNNGILLALSRRISIYTALNKLPSARSFLNRGNLVGVAIAVGASGLIATLLFATHVLDASDSLVYFFSFAGLAILWLLGGELAIARQPIWLGASLAVGLGVSLVVDRLAQSLDSPAHLVWGSLTGYCVAFAILFTLTRMYAPRHERPQAGPLHLPSFPYLVYEAAPYFTYGVLFMLLVLIPMYGTLLVFLVSIAYPLAAFGHIAPGIDRAAETTYLALGLFLAMLPMAFANGIIERALRLFWRFLVESAKSTPLAEEREFVRGLLIFHRRHFTVYLAGLIVFSTALLGGSILLISSGLIETWLPGRDMGRSLFFLESGLIAFGFIGLGVYNLTYCISLADLRPPNLAVGWGILVVIATGIPLSYFDYRWTSLAFVAGSLIFAAVSWRAVNRLLRSAAYHMAFSA